MASFSIIHFNDVYNIEPCTTEPTGGAARLAGYIKSCEEEKPVVLFSGDVLNPSLMSVFLKGEQMIPVLNGVGVQCAVFGNHDFDFGVDHLEDLIADTTFPWLISNVIDNLHNEPLANGKTSHMIICNDIKIGLVGLVEEEWIETLATLDPEDVTYIDYVESGRQLSQSLKERGAEIVIALTHMRWPNDTRLAEQVDAIDIILGGHDHDYIVKQVNGKYIVKSGTDFRNLSHIMVTRNDTQWQFDIKRVDLDSSVEEDPIIKNLVIQKLALVDDKMDTVLGDMLVELEGRFSKIRTEETNLGNFVTDIILTATNADVALLNSGTFRSDRVHARGEFKIRDLLTILPLIDNLVVLKVTGSQIIQALENAVSQYPKLEGRFPQVSGIQFGFDPSKARGHRVDSSLVKIQGHYIDLEQEYRLCTKEYIACGKDGYTVFKNCEILVSAENCPTLSTTVQNHFESVQIIRGTRLCKSGHKQSLLCLVRKQSLVCNKSSDSIQSHKTLVRQQSIHDAEIEQRHLAPMVEERIFQYDDEKRVVMLALKDSRSLKRLRLREEEYASSIELEDNEEYDDDDETVSI